MLRRNVASYMKPDCLQWTKGGWDDLTAYRWNTGLIEHSFCPVCGIHVGTNIELKGMVAINVRCVDNLTIDVHELKVWYCDGKNTMPLKNAQP